MSETAVERGRFAPGMTVGEAFAFHHSAKWVFAS